MFQFTACPRPQLWIGCGLTGVFPAGFPHSDIRGSLDIGSSPRLFAADRVLRRLLAPRHPPFALYSLIERIVSLTINRAASRALFDSLCRFPVFSFQGTVRALTRELLMTN